MSMGDDDLERPNEKHKADDEAELARMGYKQELKRDLSLLQVIL